MKKTVLVVGGGAAGVFAAIAAAEGGARVLVLERGAQLLAKVKISGGGRCNFTHACFDPKTLVKFYPRGGKALLGPFHKFQPRDTVRWFNRRGVETKTEDDGRMFPASNDSQTIIDALLTAAKKAGVELRAHAEIKSLERTGQGFRALVGAETIDADRVLLATGGGHQGHAWARAFGHNIESPVPSLFTFTVKDARLEGLAGVAVEDAEVEIAGSGLGQRGPLLITHWGLSGPAVLKLSAWGARYLHGTSYKADLVVNWDGGPGAEKRLEDLRQAHPRKLVGGQGPEGFPQRLWERLARAAGADQTRWAELTKDQRQKLLTEWTAGSYRLDGKGVFKEEFVTAGGVRLDEVDFRTMESRICPGLFFAGEILDVDGLTGGFNFQNAWTTGVIAGRAIGTSGPSEGSNRGDTN